MALRLEDDALYWLDCDVCKSPLIGTCDKQKIQKFIARCDVLIERDDFTGQTYFTCKECQQKHTKIK